MRRYETIFIADPDLAEDGRSQVFEKVKGIIEAQGGFLAEFDEWGIKKLAYDIKKKTRGYYVRMDICGTGDMIAEMERTFRLDDKILKFMTILLESVTDVERVKEEIAGKEETTEEKAAETPVETAAEPETAETEESDTVSNEEEK